MKIGSEKMGKYSEKNRAYYKANREQILQKRKEYYEADKQKLLTRAKKYQQVNLRKLSAEGLRKYHQRYRYDNEYRLSRILRARLSQAIKHNIKSAPTQELLGCSVGKLCTHLEGQFQLGMTWKNHGREGWHIDHIKPCASFDLTDPEEQKRCFHYTNLQPLWAVDNLKKGFKHTLCV